MTTPIKPPAGDGPVLSLEEIEETVPKDMTDPLQNRLVDGHFGTAELESARANSNTSSVEHVISGLQSGSLTADNAVDLLVELALDRSRLLGGVAESTRRDLEELFRHALNEDPGLLTLVKELRSMSR